MSGTAADLVGHVGARQQPVGPDRAATFLAMRVGARVRRRRAAALVGALTIALVAASITSMTVGEYPLSPIEVVGALVGRADGGVSFVVLDLRLPRLSLAILVGVAFGLSGTLFQSVLRNPLASPDVIGISQGASVGAVLALLVLHATGPVVSAAALGGALVVGAALYVVSWRNGLVGHRFVLSGIGLAYMSVSVVGYLLTRAQVQEAQTALTWLTGSIAAAEWGSIRLLALALLVLLPGVAVVAPGLAQLGLGDDAAAALGARTETVRVAAIVLGVCLSAVATAAVGPLAFVALTAGPIARRLLGGGRLGLLPSALIGAVLVVLADLIAQHFLPGSVQMPAGVVTGLVGGPYLIWLLATSRRGGKVA